MWERGRDRGGGRGEGRGSNREKNQLKSKVNKANKVKEMMQWVKRQEKIEYYKLKNDEYI